MNAFNTLKPKASAKPAPKPAPKAAPKAAPKPSPAKQQPQQAGSAKRPSRAVGEYQVVFDELPKQRASTSKYDALLARWPVGAAVRCTAEETGAIAHALRKHLRRTGKSGRARICTQYPGDTSSTPARVWWLDE